MSLPVVLRALADRDLQDARDGYEARHVGLGIKFARRALDTLTAIGQFPELFGVVGHGVRAATIRRFPHVIYYRVLADRVEVLAVLHGSQDATAWQARVTP